MKKRKGVRAAVPAAGENDGDVALPDPQNVEYMQNHLHQQSGNQNVGQDASMFMKSVQVSIEDIKQKVADDIMKVPLVIASVVYLDERKSNVTSTASLNQIAHRARVGQMITGALPTPSDELFSKMVDISSDKEAEDFQEVFHIVICVFDPKFKARSLSPLGLPLLMLVLRGSMFLFGVPFSKVQGGTLPLKISTLKFMAGPDLAKHVSDFGFSELLKPGCMILVPPGMLIMQLCEEATVCLRGWTLPAAKGSWSDGPAQTLSMATEIC
eukprot:CAMPEP_0177543242 /NCGR_PEP_ID=MMETSP0369-20130122/61264_1 /TAXON_ID=447022 ORGANISM="Scrippsiella hangoei-like, Strain SHHI-4" /NCGR_SAMPLE_ID=MMETSP0369 /ASSEMBLY_ACC=CAM_ASM_000364 /LENGTH=268 /DNA_ID=CAMNT_0019027023 /DNA_START=39 /DNA_END=845 /DNA_ORIENTATION=+